MARESKSGKAKSGRGARGRTILIELEPDDFRAVAGAGEVDVLVSKQPAPEVDREDVLRMLPAVVAEKLAGNLPRGFRLTQFTIAGELEVKPFNIGLSGSVELTFRREPDGAADA